MEHFHISRDSWHYRLVSLLRFNVSEDICGYSRQLIFSMIMALALFVLAAGLTVSSMSLLMWVVVCVEYGVWLDLEPHSIPAVVFGGAGLLIYVLFLIIDNPVSIAAPGFVRTAYRSFHNKFCVPLKFYEKR